MTIHKIVKGGKPIQYDEDVEKEVQEILKNANKEVEEGQDDEKEEEGDEDIPDLEDITDSDEEDNPLDELE